MDLQNFFRPYVAPYFSTLFEAFVNSRNKRAAIFCMPLWLLTLWATYSVRHNFFFWDTVQLASQHAQFFYDTHFSTLLLPDNMDSGHPPTFGLYMASMWKLFGKSLIVSHLVMLPFLLGIIWEAYKLGEKFLGEWQAIYFPFVLICNPIMASQAILVSPDVVLIFFFLLALNRIFTKYEETPYFNTLLFLAIAGLCLISMRGMMVAFFLFLYDILVKILDYDPKLKTQHSYKGVPSGKTTNILRGVLPYVLGSFFGIGFLMYHFINKGWIGYHTQSEWVEAFQRVDFQGFIKNVVVLIWRLIDFGHLWLWILILYLFFKINNRFVETVKLSHTYPFFRTRFLIYLLILSIFILTPTLLIYKGLSAHRYLLPIYMIINFLCLKLISDLKAGKWQNTLYIITFLGLLTGNFWVYPQPISTGWDATLAHLPYYKLRNEMNQYIEKEHIDRQQIGTAFPNVRPTQLIDLQDNIPFSQLDFDKNGYIFYSNIMNDFTKNDLEKLKKEWRAIKILRGGQVELVLYKKDNFKN